MGLIQGHILAEALERSERIPSEEEAIPRVVREAPEGHRPLIPVREGEQDSLSGMPLDRQEARRTPDHLCIVQGRDDRLDEIRGRDAIRVNEQEDVRLSRLRAAVAAFARAVPLSVQDDRSGRPGLAAACPCLSARTRTAPQ